MDIGKKIYAHSLKGQPPEKWQTLEEHLLNVAELAVKFAESFASADWAYNSAILHDIGKALPAFQSYLLKQNGMDDPNYDGGDHNHSSVGAAFAMEKYGDFIGKIYAYLSAGHHAGLPDWYGGNSSLSVRLKEGRENLAKIKDFAGDLDKILRISQRPPFTSQKNLHFWIRMLFSCLVDADSLDTENFCDPQKSSGRSNFAKISALKEKFDSHMCDLANSAKNTSLNKIRAAILSSCREKAKVKQGIFSLSVPTGGGKTLSSMAFALEHAMKFEKRRIIYAIPYTSIIEQTANIFKRIFGADQVLEHHSNIDFKDQPPKMDLAAENWDAPIIVTTNVQFFESLYAAKRSRCRKLHNIANSIVILDEAQLLPPKYLAPCVWVLKELSQHYAVSIVLSTATQPHLKWLDQIEEIAPDPAKLYDSLPRVEISFPKDPNLRSNWGDIAKELLKFRQVLCVVNSRKDCRELHSLMPPGSIHLSALMCGEHRSQIIEEIKRRLENDEDVRVVSTQLVEAGVDIDFPVVYRAFTGFDSIVQAAGRCNREGKIEKGKVFVFMPPQSSARGALLKSEDISRELLSVGVKDLNTPETFKKYFSLFYDSLNSSGEEYFHNALVRNVINISFRSYADDFKIVDDKDSHSIIVRYARSESLIDELKKIGKPTREIMRQLQRFCVSIHSSTFAQMLSDGLIEEIFPNSGIFVQTMKNIYSNSTGLEVYSERLPASDLLI